ncbi:serine/threonine-protein phosphatase 7 long form homolog [Gossypium hirsutum]|uniref:Serine/threonine-protein phosphatase 7 long form homolog n=1 Tax=Gossypium hirsutum TaxID=3635 RepID=A0A1U8ITE4_GOSHI|nr:serine/threonine-protein phosphatase 7 long form homolog [Gossypium hirsutum]
MTNVILGLAEFRSTTLIQTFDLQCNLISTLVERWCPETCTFHLLRGECINTLEDVALQLELPIDGSGVTGVSTIFKLAALCDNLLGVSPGNAESKFMGLRFSWLKASFEHLPINATERELLCTARLGFRSTGYVVLRAFLDDKAFCCGQRWMPHIVAVLGSLLDAILGTDGVSIRVEVIHSFDIPSDD